MREDAKTSQRLKTNTLMYPKCENNIEKNGGYTGVHILYFLGMT